MLKIFISYRRDDSAYPVAMLCERLRRQFGDESVFLDIDNIPLGVDFRTYIGEMVGQCSALLAVIGNQWLTIAGKDGAPRLSNPRDPVRAEIEAAFEHNILVVPVLVDKAQMPDEYDLPESLRSLANRNGTEVRTGKDMQGQIDRLVAGLAHAFERRAAAMAEMDVQKKEEERKAKEAQRLIADQAARAVETERRRLEAVAQKIAAERAKLEQERESVMATKYEEEQRHLEDKRLAAAQTAREAEALVQKIADERNKLEQERKAIEQMHFLGATANQPASGNLVATENELLSERNCNFQIVSSVSSEEMGILAKEHQKNGLDSLLEKLQSEPNASFTDPVTGIKFMMIRGGRFQMGDASGDGSKDESPAHEVFLSSFAISMYPVTRGQFRIFVDSTGFSAKEDMCTWDAPGFPQDDSHPVVFVSWHDAVAFARWLSAKTGQNYRLPTEAEWEIAATGGEKNKKYGGGNEYNAVAWHAYNSGMTTHPVGQKMPNGLGVHDMIGNVLEWCSDYYDTNFYRVCSPNNPRGPSEGATRVLRGGYFGSKPGDLRISKRFSKDPQSRGFEAGFRLVLTP